jgi:tetratricopeptide (TPR) repeat protein
LARGDAISYTLRWFLGGIVLCIGCGHHTGGRTPSPTRPTIISSQPADLDAGHNLTAFIESQLEVLDKGDPVRIAKHLEKVLTAHPHAVSVHVHLATQYIRLQQWSEALAVIERALTIDANHLEANFIYARLLVFRDETPKAIRLLDRLRRTRPLQTEIYSFLARLHIQHGAYRQAERVMQQLRRRIPDSLTAYYYLATLYGNHLKQTGRAVQMFRRLIDLQPGNLQARSALAQLYLKGDQKEQALAEYLDMERYSPVDVGIQLRIAVLYFELRDNAEAITRIERVLAVQPAHHKLRYYLGVMYEETGKRDAARATYLAIPPTSKFYRDAMMRVAVSDFNAKDLQAALGVLRRAIRKRPKTREFYEYLAFLHQRSEQPGKAARVLLQAARKVPDASLLYYKVAILYEQMQQRRRAVKMMLKVLENHPRHMQALNYVGYTYAVWGTHLDEAETYLQRAIELDPKNGHVIDSLAWVYYQRGEFDQAWVLLERANTLTPHEPTILRHMAQTLIATGRAAEARVYLQRGLQFAKGRAAAGIEEVGEIERVLQRINHT